MSSNIIYYNAARGLHKQITEHGHGVRNFLLSVGIDPPTFYRWIKKEEKDRVSPGFRSKFKLVDLLSKFKKVELTCDVVREMSEDGPQPLVTNFIERLLEN